MMSEELESCPFCGGEATDAHQSGSVWFIGGHHRPDCHFSDFQRTKAEAIAAWNTRAPSPSTDVSELFTNFRARLAGEPYWRPELANAVAQLERDVAAIAQQDLPHEVANELIAELRAKIINSPETADFMDAVPIEAAHQRDRWGSEHDAGKTPFDWFWLIGYLSQKAADAAVRGDTEKAKHHTISTAGALANWHAALAGVDTSMRPGISDPAISQTGEA